MHESYVSLEIAKPLKKLGFKWGCRAAWDLTFPDEPYLNYDAVYQTDFNNDVDDILYAPTLSVAQRWLREVKKLYIEIRRMPKCDLFDRYFTSIAIMQEPFDTELRDKDDEIIYISGKTYEEALEAAIKKALEIILEIGE